MYQHTKKEVSVSTASKVIAQTDRHPYRIVDFPQGALTPEAVTF